MPSKTCVPLKSKISTAKITHFLPNYIRQGKSISGNLRLIIENFLKEKAESSTFYFINHHHILNQKSKMILFSLPFLILHDEKFMVTPILIPLERNLQVSWQSHQSLELRGNLHYKFVLRVCHLPILCLLESPLH